MRLARGCGLAWLLFCVAAAHAQEGEKPVYNPYAGTLKDGGVQPTLEGVNQYLTSLVPTEEEKQKRAEIVAGLIAQLGDANFHRREQAMRAIAAMPEFPHAEMQAATRAADPEIRWRSDRLIKQSGRPNPLPEAVLRTIALLKIQGAAPAILEAMPAFAQPHVQRAAADALIATARKEDADLLREELDGADEGLRLAAISAYGVALGEESSAVLEPLLRDENAKVRLTAARAVANFGSRAALPVLGELLRSDDIDIRAQAALTLTAFTNQQISYVAYDKPEAREAAAGKWLDWIQNEGDTAELIFPLPAHGTRAEIGHTLVLLYQQGKAVELDAEGNTVWEKAGLNLPWAGERLANGNTLIGSYRGQFIAEYDREGNEVWRKDGLPGGVFGVQRLPNGNTLLGLHRSRKVLEVDAKGDTVWEVTCNGQPMSVERLANGNTLVSLNNTRRVVEIDAVGSPGTELEFAL